MISLNQLYQSGAPTGRNIYITNLSLDVQRKFLNESFSNANVYAFNFEGNIYHSEFVDGKLSTILENKITEIASGGKFNYRIKSLSFPNAATDLSENIRFSKFDMSVEFQEKTSDRSRFSDYTGGADFTALIPEIIESSGEFIQDISETFSFDEGEAGAGKFSHSVNFTLLPVTGDSIKAVIESKYLRNTANSIITGFTNYSNFVNISKLFTGRGFQFNNNFFTQHTGRMTHSETADILGNTYSLTRSKTYYTGYNEFYCFDHNYTMNVASNGAVEIEEETKAEGEEGYAQLINRFNTEIDPLVSDIVNGGNTYTNIRKSYSRCAAFLSGYHQFLRLRKSESDTAAYFSHYTDSTSLYSLRPIPIEKTLTSIPELPSLVSNVKYTTDPGIKFGYESREVAKIDKEKGIIHVAYDANLKVFSFQTGDFILFNSQFGSQPDITNFASFVNNTSEGIIKRSSALVHSLINYGPFEHLKDGSAEVPFALIKKSSSRSRRGKDLSVNLTFSSDNKYAPLYFAQDPAVTYTITAPPKEVMFNNLIIPTACHQFIADNFTLLDKKVSITVPQEKFTQRIVLARNQGVAIIDPSVQSSTGKLSIAFSFKMKKNNLTYPLMDSFFRNGVVSVDDYINHVRTLIFNLFDPSSSLFAPMFHATVNSEISKVIDGRQGNNKHPINGYVPTSITYKFDSAFNLEISVGVEFYSKSEGGKRKPIFGFHGNTIYGPSINTSSLFDQSASY